jgi:hypothetical protein
MKRRTFLKGVGAVTILAAGGRVWRAFGQAEPEFGEGPAFELWRSWRRDSRHGPLALVHAAILGANAFNTQPWLFRVSDSRIDVYADTRRNLGAFDPYLREMFFSLGCAIENLCLAAPPNGLEASPSLIPGALAPPTANLKPDLAARIELTRRPRSSSELFEAIPHRHTNRNAFDGSREVSPKFIDTLAGLAGKDSDVRLFLHTTETDRKAITEIIWDSSKRLFADPAVQQGTKPWYRATIDQVQKLRDGAYVGDSDLKSYVDLMMSGRLFGLLAVRDRYDRPQTIRAGRVWQRAHLLATARGLAARPANGAVEIIDHERQMNLEPLTAPKLARLTGDASWQPTFMFYMGHPTVPARASARRSMDEVIL